MKGYEPVLFAFPLFDSMFRWYVACHSAAKPCTFAVQGVCVVGVESYSVVLILLDLVVSMLRPRLIMAHGLAAACETDSCINALSSAEHAVLLTELALARHLAVERLPVIRALLVDLVVLELLGRPRRTRGAIADFAGLLLCL